jgi:hypothetical protein
VVRVPFYQFTHHVSRITPKMSDPSNAPTDHTSLRQYLKRLEENIKQVSRRLKRFEEEFGMDSEAFP